MPADTATLILRVRNDKYNRDLKRSEKFAKNLAKANVRAKKEVLALAAGFVAGAIAAVKITKAFTGFTKESLALSRGLAEVSTLIDASPAGMERLKRGVLELSSELGFLSSDSVPALYQALSASVPEDNVIEFLRVAGKAAVGGVTNLETAVDGLTSVLNAYSLESKDAERVSDIFFTTIKRGKTVFRELSQGIGLVAPLANAAGVELEELFGIIAALTKQGLRTDIALTGIRGTLTSLLNPNERLITLLDKLTKEGKDVEISSRGLLGVLQEISNAVDGDAKQIAKLIPNVRGLNAILALLKDEAKGSAADIKAVTEEVGSLGKAFQKIQDDPSQSAKTLAADFEQLKQSAGDLVKETGLVAWLADVAKGLNELAKQSKTDIGVYFGGRGAISKEIGTRFGAAVPRAPRAQPPEVPGVSKGDKDTVAWLKGFQPGTDEHEERLKGQKKIWEQAAKDNQRRAALRAKEFEAEERRRVAVRDRLKSLKNEIKIQKLLVAGKKREAFIQERILAAGELTKREREALTKAAGRLFDLQETEAGPAGPSASLAAAMSEGSAAAMNTLRRTQRGGPEEKTAKNTESIDKTLKRSLGKGMALVPVNLGAQ